MIVTIMLAMLHFCKKNWNCSLMDVRSKGSLIREADFCFSFFYPLENYLQIYIYA